MVGKSNRSQAYQHLFAEIACSHDMLSAFPNDSSIYSRLTGGFAYDERVLELQDQLKVEFWRIVDDCLTERQRELVHLNSDGLTQMEIAKVLKVNQSTVHKSLRGNAQKDANGSTTIYGGIIKRLQMIAMEDPEIQAILRQIAEIRNDTW